MLKSTTPSAQGPWSGAQARDSDAATSLWGHVVAAAQAYLAALAQRRLRRRAMQELERLDDRILRDIGVTRSEIGYVVRYGRGS